MEMLTQLSLSVDLATEVKLYIDVEPVEATFKLDNIEVTCYEQDPNWKTDADIRIDELRKVSLNLEVHSEEEDVMDAEVELIQLTHSFPFGTAVRSPYIAECVDTAQDTAFCEYIKNNYNWLVDNFRMKWKPMEPSPGEFESEIPDKLISWAENNNMQVRGHALLWAKQQNQPFWAQDMQGQPLVEAMYNRVEEALTHFEGKVGQWDVINEMLQHDFYIRQTGDPEIRNKIFALAKETSPNVTLFLNDYNVLVNKQSRFEDLQQQIRQFLADGAPVEAIGLQSHFSQSRINVDLMKKHLDLLWEEFKLPIWITEWTWSSNGGIEDPDFSVIAEQLENFYRMAFSHEAIQGIMMWLIDFDGGELVDANIIPNKGGEAYLKLYHEEWRSSGMLSPLTTSSSLLNFGNNRVFRGKYQLNLFKAGQLLGSMETTLEEDTDLCLNLAGQELVMC